MSNENEETNVEPQGVESSQVEEREMYIGSRISCVQHEVMEHLYKGSIHNINEVFLIVVLATEGPRDYPFWITKFMKVNKENEEVILVEVHWYATDTHPIDGVYKSKMVVEKNVCKKQKRKGQNINHHRIDILKLDDVDILDYNFQLIKKCTLWWRNTKIIKSLLVEDVVARWEFSKPDHRSRRNMASKMLGIDVDSDGALIDDREAYGSSTSSSNHSSKDNVDSNGAS